MEPSELGPGCAAIVTLLENSGFVCSVRRHEPGASGNFVAECSATAGNVRVTKDRGQVFVDFAVASGAWVDKEALMSRLGLSRDRHPTTEHGLWCGYEPGVQAAEMEMYLSALLREAADGGMRPSGFTRADT